jgi:hypothetical protein
MRRLSEIISANDDENTLADDEILSHNLCKGCRD